MTRPDTALPEGFRYQPDFLSREEEHSLLRHIEKLPFREFEFHGFTGKRRNVSFGWRYDFNGGGLTKTEDMPEFLLAVRAHAGSFTAISLGELQQVLVTVYAAGASIGWHKDRAVFGDASGSHFSLPAPSACAAKQDIAGSGTILLRSRARFTFCAGLRERSGSIGFRRR